MIAGISSSFGGVSAAAARFDVAAGRVSAATETLANPDTMDVGGTSALSDAMVQMAVARFAFLASIHVALTTSDMVSQALQLGGHTSGSGTS